ncbi:MAG: RHS repeat protein, partial [Phycisphaerae bacterium]|nr:RHS repeat protein [Phycisphaerae bacterium]
MRRNVTRSGAMFVVGVAVLLAMGCDGTVSLQIEQPKDGRIFYSVGGATTTVVIHVLAGPTDNSPIPVTQGDVYVDGNLFGSWHAKWPGDGPSWRYVTIPGIELSTGTHTIRCLSENQEGDDSVTVEVTDDPEPIDINDSDGGSATNDTPPKSRDIQKVILPVLAADGVSWLSNKPEFRHLIPPDPSWVGGLLPPYNIMPFSGEVYYEKTDVTIMGRGFDFEWKRTYRSREEVSTPMGHQWNFSYNVQLTHHASYDVVVMSDGSGGTVVFTDAGEDCWAALGWAKTLEYDSVQEEYTLTRPDGTRWLFHDTDESQRSGRLFRIVDRNGNQMDLDWNATTGLLEQITDTLGREIEVNYDAQNRIESLSDAGGDLVTYEYYGPSEPNGSDGDLKSITCRAVSGTPNGNDFPNGKTWTYEYTQGLGGALDHNLTAIRDAKGNVQRSYTYFMETIATQPRFDRVASESCAGGTVSYFYGGYSSISGSVDPNAVTMTRITDQMGNVEEQYFDERNLLTTRVQATRGLRATDPSTFVTRYEYDDLGRPTREISPSGSEVQYTYPSSSEDPLTLHNTLKITRLPGSAGGEPGQIVESYEYHPTYNIVTKATDGRGNHTTYTYDASNGDLLEIAYPSGDASETFEYNAYGQVISATRPTGRVDAYTYQDGYRHQEVVDSGGLSLTTTYGYNGYGVVTSVTDARGNTTSYVLNQLNQIVREIAPTPLSYQIDYFYDENDNLARKDVQNVDRDGNVQANSHYTTLYERNALDQVIRVTQEVASGQNVVTEYEHDAKGRVILTKSGEATNNNQPANTVSRAYDERDLLFQEVRAPDDVALKSTTQYDYDAKGNLAYVRQGTESEPRVWAFTNDGYGRRILQTDPEGNVTTFSYDANGNRTKIRVEGERIQGESGSNTLLAEANEMYDAMNRLIQRDVAFLDASGASIGSGWATTKWFYDAGGNVIAIQDDNGKSITQTYDTADRLLTQADGMGNSQTFTRDGNGNVTTLTEVDKSVLLGSLTEYVTTNVYDARNRLTSTTDPNENEWQFGHDSLDNQTLRIDPRGNQTTYEYDGLKRLIATTRVLTDTGTGDGNQVDTIVTTQAWDDNSRLTAQTDDSGHTTSYTYDALDRISGVTYADGTTNAFTYDRHDNRISAQDGNGSAAANTYDLLNRLTARSITPGTGVVGTTAEVYKYNGLGKCVYAQNSDPNGVVATVTLGYNSLGRVESQTLNGQTVESTFDGVGNETQTEYPGGRTVTTTYDDLNRRHVISSNQGGTLATYYYVGKQRVEAALFGNNVGMIKTFDSGRRTTTLQYIRDPLTVDQTTIDARGYTWDASSNRTQRTNVLTGLAHAYAYDSVNRMKQSTLSTDPPTVITYGLDGVGNRTTVTGGDNPGTYAMDANNPPSDATMNQYTTTPMDARTYDDNGNLAARTGTSPPAGAFAYDYRNRMIRFTEALTGRVHTYAYDCFGRLIKKYAQTAGGEVETRYYYKGKQIVEERDGSDTVQATFVHGNYIDEVVTMRRGASDYYYIQDDQYNVMGLMDDAG